MNSQQDFYMEPIVFISDAGFLSGTGESMEAFDLITDMGEAKRMLLDQNLPAPYACWNDFFSELISNIILDKIYNHSQRDILDNSKALKSDALKENIRKRKAFLLRKKMGCRKTNLMMIL